MDDTSKDRSKIIQAILQKPDINKADILYALQMSGNPVSRVANALGCSEEFIYMVIAGTRRSRGVAIYISDALNTTPSHLWGDAYNYTSRKRQPAAKHPQRSGK